MKLKQVNEIEDRAIQGQLDRLQKQYGTRKPTRKEAQQKSDEQSSAIESAKSELRQYANSLSKYQLMALGRKRFGEPGEKAGEMLGFEQEKKNNPDKFAVPKQNQSNSNAVRRQQERFNAVQQLTQDKIKFINNRSTQSRNVVMFELPNSILTKLSDTDLINVADRQLSYFGGRVLNKDNMGSSSIITVKMHKD